MTNSELADPLEKLANLAMDDERATGYGGEERSVNHLWHCAPRSGQSSLPH